jgi:hypothetical protein
LYCGIPNIPSIPKEIEPSPSKLSPAQERERETLDYQTTRLTRDSQTHAPSPLHKPPQPHATRRRAPSPAGRRSAGRHSPPRRGGDTFPSPPRPRSHLTSPSSPPAHGSSSRRRLTVRRLDAHERDPSGLRSGPASSSSPARRSSAVLHDVGVVKSGTSVGRRVD